MTTSITHRSSTSVSWRRGVFLISGQFTHNLFVPPCLLFPFYSHNIPIRSVESRKKRWSNPLWGYYAGVLSGLARLYKLTGPTLLWMTLKLFSETRFSCHHFTLCIVDSTDQTRMRNKVIHELCKGASPSTCKVDMVYGNHYPCCWQKYMYFKQRRNRGASDWIVIRINTPRLLVDIVTFKSEANRTWVSVAPLGGNSFFKFEIYKS